jgi:hypothetical protein
MIYRCLIAFYPTFVIVNSNWNKLYLDSNSYPLNNKSFKTGAEVEPANFEQNPKDNVS